MTDYTSNSSKQSYTWGLNERYYIDSEGNIEESDGESPPQTGTVSKFVAIELLRLAEVEKRVDGELSLSEIECNLAGLD